MDDSKTVVGKNNHDLNHQLGLSDDDLISKFSDDFSLKLLSPLVRLKRELHLSLPDLVPRQGDQENSGRPCKNGQYLDGLREENRVDTRLGRTNNDGFDLGRSNLHEETLEKPCNDNEPLQPRLNSNKGDKRTEDVADKKVVKIKGKRGRPPKNVKQVGGAVTESTSCSKRPHSESTVFPPRKRGRPRKNGITGYSNAQKVLPTSVPISRLSGATKRQRNHPCKKSKVGFTAVKDQIVRNYPLRRLFHSTSRDKLVSRRFPGYAKVLGPVAQNISAHSQKRNRQCTSKASQRTVKNTQHVTGELSEAKYISQDIKEPKEKLAESCRSKLYANLGHTAVSVEPRGNKTRTSARETCEGVPSAISPKKGNLACTRKKGNSKKKSKSMFKLVRSHSVERLPSPPVCVDPSSKMKMWEPFSRCSGKHVSETNSVYDFTDSTDESLCVPTSPLTNKPQHKRGRPSKQKVGHAVGTKQIRSRTGLPHRKHCMNKSEMIPSRNFNRLNNVHSKDEPQKKRSRGRPRKLKTNEFKSQEISKEGTHKLLHVQKPDRLYQENGYVKKDVEKEAEFTDWPLHQERLPGDKLPETVGNSTLFFVPNLVESGQQKKDVSLHHTQPKPVRDDGDHMSSALWTPGWKDKPVSEYQGGSDQVTCLTPPGSNECLSTSGDEFPQTLEEPCIQKACQNPSNITTSSSSSAQDFVARAITFSPSSNPGLPHFHQDATITDTSQDLLDRMDSCSPFVLQVKSIDNSCSKEQNKSITNGGQENLHDLFMEATDNPIQESDGLSQIRIAKTFTLSKDELSSTCAESEDVDTHDNEASLITSLHDVPVKIPEASSSSPRRERENIFQALRGSLNSQCSSLDRDFNQSGSNSSTQRDDWHPEQMSVSYPEIPHLEAYGGGQSDYASHNSPHSGDSDTLPVLEKEAFHDTCLDDDDDDDEFEFENPSDVALEFNKTSDDIPEQNYSHNWPDGSGPPQSKTDIIIGAEPVHQDLQNEAIGVAEDEDEFEFETPIESEATHAYELSSEENPPESHNTVNGSLHFEQEYLHDEDSLMCTPQIGEQTEPEHRCDGEHFKNSFPIIGISPNHLEYSTSLPSKSTSGNSSPRGGTEIQDCKSSQSNNLQNLSIPSSVENTERLNENADAVQEVHRSPRALPKILSKDEQQNHIINIQNDQEKNSIVQNSDNISKQDDESNMPEDQMVQEMAQDESSVANDRVMKEIDSVEFEIEPGMGGRDEQSNEKNNSAECNGEKSEKHNNFQETSGEHSQSMPVDAGKAKDEAHHSNTDDAIGECQELLPLTDAEEIPISIVDRCPPDALDEEQSADSKICDVVNSEECKAPTLVHEGDTVRCGQDIAKDYSRAATDLQENVRPSKIADFEVCTREEKVDDEVAEVPEKNLDKLDSNDSVGQVSPEEIINVGGHSPVTQHEETELQGERLEMDLHKVQEVMSDQCPMTIGTSSKDIENETKSTSEDMEEELSDNVKVPPHSDANVKLASFPLSKTSSEELHDTFVSKEGAGEDTSALSKIEDCSKVMELQEKLEETQTTLSTSGDVKESCTISIDKTDGKTDRTKNNGQQKLGSDSTKRKNDNQLSSDLHSDPDMEHSQPAPLSTLQLSQMADAMQQSNPSKFNSDEHESHDHENQESNNSLPCSPKEGDKVEDQSPDPQLSLQFALQEQETAKLHQSQKKLATEDLGQDCLTECGTTDQTMRNESVSSHTHPNGLCESSANLTITSQDGSNSKDVISCSELPQASDKLIGLVEARKQTNPDDCVYLGVSTSDGTMDMLSVACEETIGGYDEDAMSTTSSGGATIAYPLSDREDWNDQPELNENNVIEGGLSSPVQDMPSLPITGLHGKDVEHSSSLTACKWTVKFTKPKKRKRSRDRHHTKNKRKSNKNHKESRTKSKERHGKRHLKMTIVADAAAILESKSDDTAAELPEKHDFEQEEHPKSPLKEVAIDQEPIKAITDHPSVEKEIRGDLEKQKSPQETLLVSNSSCKVSIPKSPHCHITHIHESSPTEASAQSEIMNPKSTDEKLADSNSDKKLSSGVCKGSELLNGSPLKVDVAAVSVEDPAVVIDNPSTPRIQSAGQESYDTSVSALLRNLVSQIQTSVSPGSLSTTHDATAVVGIKSTVPPSGYMVNHQREVSTMLHTAKSSVEEGDVCVKTVQYIPQDKATFFGTPSKDKTQIKPRLNITNSAVPLHGSYYSAPVQQSTHFLPQQHVLPMIPLRHVYPKQSGACVELKQHLLRKQKLSAPDLQMLHQPQSQLAAPNQGYLTQQNTKLQNSVMHSSERDMALNQLAELRMQSQLERKRQNASAANRHNVPLTFHQVQMYPDSYFQTAQKDLPVQTNNNPSGAQNISTIPGELGHKESERLQFPGSRVSTAGTFSPPIADELPKMSTKLQAQILNKSEHSRVGYSISPAHHHVGYTADIPVYTATGPKEQLLAVYAPILQNEIPSPLNHQHARKSLPAAKQPRSYPGKRLKSFVDQDEMLNALRQLHGGGSGTNSVRNVQVIRDQLGSQTSGIPLPETAHILENKRLNQIPVMIHQPSAATNPELHQPLNQPLQGVLSNVALTEIAEQRKNMVDPKHVLYHPHTLQGNQENSLTGAAINFHNTALQSPTPRMLSRTPTPKSCTTSTTYASDSLTNLSHQPMSSELERVSLSRTSTPRSHCTPSTTPHLISDSTLSAQAEFPKSQLCQNNSTPEEDMPLDLTCKVRTKVHVEQKLIAPLDLSCRQRIYDTESQEQQAAQLNGEVLEENGIQDIASRSRLEHSGSDVVKAYDEAQVLGSQSHVQSEITHSSNSYASVEPGQERSLEQPDCISHQDMNISGQVLNTDMHGSELRRDETSCESIKAANSSIQEQYAAREANVYIDRAGQPHAFSELLHHGLTSEGPGLKIAKTYNTYVNPPSTSASSIPFIDLTSLPTNILQYDGSAKSSVEVHHTQEQVPDETNAKTSTNSEDQQLHGTHHLRRTRSDETKVRQGSSSSPTTNKASIVAGVERSKNQLDVSYIAPKNKLRSISTSNIAVTSTESNLQVEDNQEQLKSKIQQNLQSMSDLSQCPKKRFKRAHEASMKQTDDVTLSKMPAVRTDSEVTEAAASPHPSGSRKRGRPRGSKRTLEVSQPEALVNQQCKFCEFETASRQEMKNHVNEIHFEKYRTKAASEKSNIIINNPGDRHDRDTGKRNRLSDEYRTSLTPEMGPNGSKVLTNTPSKDDMPDGIRTSELSQEISEMQQTGTDYCHHCDSYFPDTSSLAAHQRTHHQSEKHNFECRLCDFSDSAPGPLVVHINKMHSKELKGGPCPFLNCSRKFSTVKEVKEHLNDHWIVKQYACKICSVRYQVLSSLKAHLDRHKQDLPNMCKDYHVYMTKWDVESASYEPIRA